MINQDNKNNDIAPERKRRYGFRWLFIKAFIVILILLNIIAIGLNNPTIQNIIASDIGEYISGKTGFDVSLSNITLDLNKGIQLTNMKVEDSKNETLLFSGNLETSLVRNLMSMLILNEYDFSKIALDNAILNINKEEGDSVSNLHNFISKLSSDKENTSNKCTKIDLDKLELKNVTLKNNLFDSSSDQNIYIDLLVVDFSKLDLCNKIIDINYLNLTSPKVKIEKKITSNNKSSTDFNLDFGYTLNVDKINIEDGNFILKQLDKSNIYSNYFRHIDFSNINVTEFEFDASDIKLDSINELSISVNSLKFKEQQGFEVNNLSIESCKLSNTAIGLKDLQLVTTNSNINGDFDLNFNKLGDLGKFADKVYIKSDFDRSTLKFADIIYFLPKMNNSSFLVVNKDKNIQLKGRVNGRINNLVSKGIYANVDNKFILNTNLVLKNITKRGDQYMELTDLKLSSNSNYVNSFFPRVNFGEKFTKLGTFNFDGSFKGKFNDFNTSGKLESDLGLVLADLNMKIGEGVDNVDYSGKLTLDNFDVGSLINNNKLGKIGIRAILEEGHGVKTNNAKAKISASVDSLVFKGYKYRNANINAYVEANKFNGDLEISDENIDLNLNGLIDFEDSIPFFNLEANLQKIDLYALNLYKKPLSIKSKIQMDFMGSNPDEFSGKVFFDNLILSNKTKKVNIDSMNISSIISDSGERYLDIDSDFLTFYFDGKYNVLNIQNAVYNIFHRNFSKFVTKIDQISQADLNYPEYYYGFNLDIPDSRDLIEVLTGKSIDFKHFNIEGNADHSRDSLAFKVRMDSCEFLNNNLEGFAADFNLYKGYGDFILKSNKLEYKGINFGSINFNTDVDKDELYFQMNLDSIGGKIGQIALSGRTVPYRDSFGIEVYGGFLSALKNVFDFAGKNRIVIGKNYINLEDFVLMEGQSKLRIQDVNNNKGIKAIINDFDIEIVDFLLRYDKLHFAGETNGYVEVPDIFDRKYFESDISVQNLKINNDSYGTFRSKVKIDSLEKSKLEFSAKLGNTNPILFSKGFYKTKEKVFYGDFNLNKFPLVFLENIINNGISNTKGKLDAHMRVYGPLKKVSITGNGKVSEGETMVDYTGVTYYFDNQNFTVNNKGIDLTGVTIKDKFGNEGYGYGGITFDRFKHFGVDVILESENMMGLNTTQSINPDYWGTAIGKIKASFKGEFLKIVQMKVDATTGSGSNLTIPVKMYVESSDNSFINFNKPQKIIKQKNKKRKGNGFELELNLNITDEADLTIIMDPNAGDNLVGKGTGLVRLLVKQDGAIEMFGDYKFIDGKYLFTLRKVVNKEFEIRPGGTITWSGDPFDAKMDIKADYSVNRIPLNNLLTEYQIVSDPTYKIDYKADVNLLLLLTGTLIKPEINFDFEFTNVDNKINSFLISKSQKLKSDPNALFTQVVGIMVWRTFLPDENLTGTFSSTYLQSGGKNTISELIETQLSGYIKGLLSEFVDGSDVISGIDFSYDSRYNSSFLPNPEKENNLFPQYHNLNATLWFLDNKMKVQIGGDYTGKAEFAERNNFFSGGNVKMEFFLTEDKRLRVKVFFNREFDEFKNEWENKSGVGIGYGRDFGKVYKNKE